MRVLFVHKQLDYELQGLMYMSSVLKSAGHEVALVVADQDDPVAFAAQYRPGLLGYSVCTGDQHYYLAMNRRIRQQIDAFSAFGGPHPTFFPEMIESEGVDGICIGEGEYALLDMVNALEQGQRVAGIANWWVKAGGEIYRNPPRPLVDDLDSLPPPDHDLIYASHKVLRRSKIKHFIAGRGCPYDCSYCFNHAYHEWYNGKGKRVRHRSVDAVIAEVRAVKEKYPLEFVVFLDDVFILARRWLTEFADRYPHEIGLPFFCNVRANLVDENLVALLKRAGCVTVSLGIEAGNDDLRNRILKRNMSKDQIFRAARLIRQAGMHLVTTNMIGLPGGTLENDLETLDLNARVRPSYANVFLFQPYPRTALGEYAVKEGYIEGSLDDIKPSAWETSIIKFSSRKEKRRIETLQKLFALGVEFPWAIPLTKQLIKVPNNPVYWLAYKLWKGYAIKKRVHPHHLAPWEYAQVVAHFMKLD